MSQPSLNQKAQVSADRPASSADCGSVLQGETEAVCDVYPIADCGACAEKFLIKPWAEFRWGYAENRNDVLTAWKDSACDARMCEQLRVKYNIKTGETFSNATNAAQFVWLASKFFDGNCDKAQCRSPFNCHVCAATYKIVGNSTSADFGTAPPDVQARWNKEGCKTSDVCEAMRFWYRIQPNKSLGDAGKAAIEYYEAYC